MSAPHTILSTEFRGGKRAVRLRLQNLMRARSGRRGIPVILLALSSVVLFGALVSFSPSGPPMGAVLNDLTRRYMDDTARAVESGSYMTIDPILQDVAAHPSTARVLDSRMTYQDPIGESHIGGETYLLYEVSCEFLFDKPEEVGRAGAVYEAEDGWLGGFSTWPEYMVLREESPGRWSYLGRWLYAQIDPAAPDSPGTQEALSGWLSEREAAYTGLVPPLELTVGGQTYLLRDGVWTGAAEELTPPRIPEDVGPAMTFGMDGPFSIAVADAEDMLLSVYLLPSGNDLGTETWVGSVSSTGFLLSKEHADYAVLLTAMLPASSGGYDQFQYVFKLSWPAAADIAAQ